MKKLTPLRIIEFVIFFSIVFYSVILISSLSETLIDKGITNLCLAEVSCFIDFFVAFSQSIKNTMHVFQISFGSIGVVGTYYALSNYISSTASAKANIHLSNMRSFSDYIIYSLSSIDALDQNNIDSLKLYNLAYPKSINGDISNDHNSLYLKWLDEINMQIKESNSKVAGEKTGGGSTSYNYNQHQTLMIDVFNRAGIKVERQTRNKYYEVESQVLELLEIINKQFIKEERFNFFKRKYV